MCALQYADIPGYSALILRRTLTELKQNEALLDRASQWLRGVPTAHYAADEHTYYFDTSWPDGSPGPYAKLQFGYLGDYRVEERYQGAEFQFCCVPQTPVLMADGSYKSIGSIKIGDLVQTLEGPSPVTRTHRLKKPCVLVLTKYGIQIQGINHRFLHGYHPKAFCTSNESHAWQAVSSHIFHQLGSSDDVSNLQKFYQDHLHTDGVTSRPQQILLEAISVLSKDGQNDFSKFGGLLQDILPLLKCSVPATLYEHPLQSICIFDNMDCRRHEVLNDLFLKEVQDFQYNYSAYPHPYDEYRNHQEGLYAHQAKLTYVAESDLPYLLNNQEHTQVCILDSKLYIHPYKKEYRSVNQTIDPYLGVSNAYLVPLPGSFDVCDITVQNASHYITMTGLVNSNCAIDEGGHFENDQAPRYLFSRLRKKVCSIHKLKKDPKSGEMVPNYVPKCMYCQIYKSIPIRFRMSCNPGGPGHLWIKNRYQIEKELYDTVDEETKHQVKRVRWVGKNSNKPFVPSSLRDNEFIDQRSYRQALQELDEVRKLQLEHGDWDASPDSRFRVQDARFYKAKGDYFVVEGRGINYRDLKRVFMTADSAATTKEGLIDQSTTRNGASHTVYSVWGLTYEYQLLWLYMKRMRAEIPECIKVLIEIYKTWRPQYVKMETNGLGIGPAQLASMHGLNVIANPKSKDKLQNSLNAQLRMRNHRIWFPEESPWLKECMDEVFTWTGHPGMTDDIVDTLSDACNDVTWEGQGNDPMFTSNSVMESDLSRYVPQSIPLSLTHPKSFGSSGNMFL